MNNKERKERQSFRAKLLREFPGGIAEVRPVKERRGPKSIMVVDPTEEQKWRVKATSVPFRVLKETGGTHQITGIPMSIPHVVEMHISPIPGRTDRFPEGRAWFRQPIDVLEYLADRDHGWGEIYLLASVPAELLDIEENAMTDPESRKLWNKLKEDYSLKSNEEVLGVNKPMVDRLNRSMAPAVEIIEEEFEEPTDDTVDPEDVRARELVEEFA